MKVGRDKTQDEAESYSKILINPVLWITFVMSIISNPAIVSTSVVEHGLGDALEHFLGL